RARPRLERGGAARPRRGSVRDRRGHGLHSGKLSGKPRSALKAAFFRRYGPPEGLEYGEMPDPLAGPGQVLVDIHAASVNAADWKQRAGQYPTKVALPHIPGRDFSGVVAAVGEGARDFRAGDEVCGVCEVPAESAYAEKIALRQEIVARKPGRFTHLECAAAGLAALTPLISVQDTLSVK